MNVIVYLNIIKLVLMDEFQFCRVCLVTDVKMFSLETKSSDSIGVFYANLAQVQVRHRYIVTI